MNLNLNLKLPLQGVIVLLTATLPFLLPSTTFAQQLETPVPPENEITTIDHDPINVTIATVDGMIVWQDVAVGLAKALSLDSPSLERMFPTGSIDLRAPTTLLVLFGIDLALGDSITIKMIQDTHGQPALQFRCDRKLLSVLAPKAKQTEPTSIQIDDDWKDRSVKQPLIVCFHGLKSQPAKFDDFRRFMRSAGYATAAISYDDHQSIADSAAQVDLVASELFKPPHQPELVLVAHSMGGLVAREWTENPKLGNPKIVRLITAGTPHGGSNWASLPPLLDLFAEGTIDSGDLVDVILHKPSAPGMRDLAPESMFLTDLRSRERLPNVRYTTIVGTGSPVTDDEVARLRETLQRLDKEGSVLRLIRPRIQPLLQSFDELARGKGDGVVAAARSTIEGVDDVVRVDLSHIDFFNHPKPNERQPVWDAVIERIK